MKRRLGNGIEVNASRGRKTRVYAECWRYESSNALRYRELRGRNDEISEAHLRAVPLAGTAAQPHSGECVWIIHMMSEPGLDCGSRSLMDRDGSEPAWRLVGLRPEMRVRVGEGCKTIITALGRRCQKSH